MTEPKRYLLLLLVLALGLSMSACGGGSNFTPAPPPAPADFTLTVQPGSVSVTQGGASSPMSVAIAPLNNFNGSVTVAISGLPSGVTASPASPFQVAAGATQSVTFSAATSASLGPVNLTVAGTSGSLSHSAGATMSINAAPDFSLSVAPGQFSVTQGASSSPATVSITSLNSFSGAVTVNVVGLPAGVTTSLASPFQLSAGAKQQITFTAASTASPGTVTAVFQATSGSISHSANAGLQVQAALIPDFSLSIDKGSLALQQGTSQAANLSIGSINSFGGNVTVSLSGLPSGVTVAPASPFTVAAGSTTQLTFTAANNAPTGSGVVTIAGANGALTHSGTAGLQVIPAATAKDPPNVSVVYFEYDFPIRQPDSQIRIVNPGVTSTASVLGDECANIYVFDSAQELTECCSCPVTANGFLQLSLFGNLTNNPNSPANFTNSFSGSVFVVPSTLSSTESCEASRTFAPVGDGLNVWGTRPAISGRLVETTAFVPPLSAAELTEMQSTCGFIERNDSGAGICSCSTIN